jgi:hypothetical protein
VLSTLSAAQLLLLLTLPQPAMPLVLLLQPQTLVASSSALCLYVAPAGPHCCLRRHRCHQQQHPLLLSLLAHPNTGQTTQL